MARINNPQQERMAYIQQVRQDILTDIYQKQEQLQTDRINRVIQQNQQLLGNGTTASFMYGEIWYTYQVNLIDIKLNRILHPALHATMHDIIHNKKFEDIIDKNNIINYIGNI